MKINFLNKKDIFKIIILFSYLVCWASISTSFDDLFINLQIQNFDFNTLINFLRHLGIYLFFFINSFFLIINFEIIKNNFKKNILYFLVFLYLLLQVPELIYAENDIKNISFIISSLTLLFSIILIDNFFSDNEKKILIYIMLVFLSLIFIAKFYSDFKNLLSGELTLYGNFDPNSKFFFNKEEPRSSGLSRSLLLIVILIESISQKSRLNKYLLDFIKIFSITIIFLMQSRLIIFLLIFYLIITFLFSEKYKLKNYLTYFLKYSFIPFLLFSLFMNNYTIQKYKNQKFDYKNNQEINFIENVKKNLRPIETFSSGRFEDWIELLNNYNFKKIFGYGAQGDRYLINQTASNGALYALSSSGILGLILFLSFSLFALFASIKNILIEINLKKSNFSFFTNLIIVIIMLRSLLESGYAVFGIDYIVFITCLSLINKQNIIIK